MDTYDKSYEKALGQFMKKKPMLPKQDPYEKVIKILFAMVFKQDCSILAEILKGYKQDYLIKIKKDQCL